MTRTRKEVEGALVGTLLGDSWISNRNEFGCEQITESLINIKANILYNIAPDIKVYLHNRKREPNGFNKNPKRTYIVQSNKHAYFKKLRTLLYPNDEKIVTKTTLNKLTPEGIALWFMDDGYFDYKKSNSTRNLRICTDSFDDLSIKNIQEYFKNTHNINTKIMMHKARKGYIPKPRISFGAKDMQKLVILIYKYFVPEMLYKINLQYKERTLNMKTYCIEEYKDVAYYILQRIPKEDIV